MPIPNGFLTKDELKKKEDYYPLACYVCESCWLVQLTHVIPPEIMFRNYLYIPSTSTTMLSHFKSMANDIVTEFHLKPRDLVIDIGSNDGTLLSYFQEHEMDVLGIDPASNLAQVARMRGVDTVDDFFTSNLAKQLVKQYGKARIISGTNVIAHVDNLHDLIKGVKILLDKDGIFVMEYPYLVDLLEKNEFDTIYHEHLSYFAVRPLIELFKKHGMQVFDVRRTPVHGGSIMVFASKRGSKYKVRPSVKEFAKLELLKKT